MKRTIAAVLFAAAGLAGCDDDGMARWRPELGGLGTMLPDSTQIANGEKTIILKTFDGPQHVKDSKYYKENTEKITHWQGLFVVHEEGFSRLYWGRYASVEDAQKNVNAARAWRSPTGQAIYKAARILSAPGLDAGPAEYNLRLAQDNYKYTVCIAMFYNMPAEGLSSAYTTRMDDAVAYCKRLRQAGEQAYFYHDAGKSYVTIGLFQDTAIESVPNNAGRFVIAIRDQRITKILATYPKLAVNGREEWTWGKDPATGQKTKIVTASYTMEIPRKHDFADSTNSPGQP